MRCLFFHDKLSSENLNLPRDATRYWVLNSGGCGSTYLAKLLNLNGIKRCYHEYSARLDDYDLDLDEEGVRYYVGDITKTEVMSMLYLTRGHIQVECSNRLFSFAKELKAVFPNSKFLHLVRSSISILNSAISLPNYGNEMESRRLRYITHLNGPIWASPFERRCHYWTNYNKKIINDTKTLDCKVLHFEDLIKGNCGILEKFLGVDLKTTKIDPVNVSKRKVPPKTISDWTPEMIDIWSNICLDTHLKLGFQNPFIG